jgi:hypothetical protein
MAASLLDGSAIDAIVALVAIECLVLVAWRVRTGGGPPIPTTVANLLAGACLLLAAREALTGASAGAIAACLAFSLVAHLADLAGRWGPSTRSP